MSSEVQPRPDNSPNTSGGSSDAEQREAAPQEQAGPEQRDQTPPKKKEAKISSKTAAKLSTSAKRIQKELAEITLDPPPNCSDLIGSEDLCSNSVVLLTLPEAGNSAAAPLVPAVKDSNKLLPINI
ncbi:Ubiquitin-conjugating enzyme E2 E2 [Dissostichus eleginoides]|nr:Ubiquitin-conjugating enzyme E2 E2 [Dissostichus eleginoides]